MHISPLKSVNNIVTRKERSLSAQQALYFKLNKYFCILDVVCTAFKTRKIMDRLTKEQRHKNMSANKGKGTQLELLFGKLLWNAGVRYRKNDKTVFGKPDFVIRKNENCDIL